MPDLKLTGVPAKPGTLEVLLKDWFGYSAVEVGGEWSVSENDPALRRGPEDILFAGYEVEITPGKLRESAQYLAEFVPDEFDGYAAAQKLPRHIELPGGLGDLTDLNLISTKLAISPKAQIAGILERELFPFLIEKLPIRRALPIGVRAGLQQSYVSFAKLGILAHRFGGQLDLRKLILDAGSFEGITFGGLDVLSAVDALTRLAPQAFTFPIRRLGCAWHFYGDGFATFPPIACHSFFQDFVAPLQPRMKDYAIRPLLGLQGLDQNNIWRLLTESVSGVNRLMKFLNDHRNYSREGGGIDFLRQLQALGAVYLLIADLLTVNASGDPHTRLTLSFGFLEKLANLRKHVGEVNGTEGAITRGLASLAQGKELKRLLNTRFGSTRSPLRNSLLPLISVAYRGLHQHLGRECGAENKSEIERLDRLWIARSLSHGTFLQTDRFERLFLQATGTIPREIVTLPYVLTWGLLSDPEAFLRFTPAVRG